MKTKTKIWVGVGAAILVAPPALGSPAHSSHRAAVDRPDMTAPHRLLHFAQARGPGGESGEAGAEKGSAAALTPEDFALKLAQIRGQLLVAEELVQQEQWAAVLLHLQHVQDTLYPEIRRQLKQYSAASFDRELRALTRLARAKKAGSEYSKAYGGIQK